MVKLLIVFFVLGLVFNSCQSRADYDIEIFLKDLLGHEQCWRGGQSVFLILKSETEGIDILLIPIAFDEDNHVISSKHHVLELDPEMFQQALDQIDDFTYNIDIITNGHSGTTIYVCAKEVPVCQIAFSCGSRGCGFDIIFY